MIDVLKLAREMKDKKLVGSMMMFDYPEGIVTICLSEKEIALNSEEGLAALIDIRITRQRNQKSRK